MSKADDLFQKAQIELAQGDVEKAVKSLKEAVKVKPDFAEAYYGLALTLTESEKARDEEIIKAFEKALELDDENSEYHLSYGSFLMSIGKFQDSEKHYNIAASLAPEDSGRILSEFAVSYYDSYLAALESRLPEGQEVPDQPKRMVEKKALEYFLKAIDITPQRAKELINEF